MGKHRPKIDRPEVGDWAVVTHSGWKGRLFGRVVLVISKAIRCASCADRHGCRLDCREVLFNGEAVSRLDHQGYPASIPLDVMMRIGPDDPAQASDPGRSRVDFPKIRELQRAAKRLRDNKN